MSDQAGFAPVWLSRPGGTLVAALGNPLCGDDGVGIAILEALAGSNCLPSGVVLCECPPGRLLEQIYTSQPGKVIILDAAEMGRAPGEWARFTPGEVTLPLGDEGFRWTLHTASLAEVLALGDALGVLPPQMVIYGVQPEKAGPSPGLSESVRRSIPEICTAIIEESSCKQVLEFCGGA